MKRLLACSASSLLLLAGAAQAADVGVLMADGSMAIVDTAAKKVIKTMKVTGTAAPLVGVDVRPADGVLYGLTADGTLYTIATDGKATMKSKLETMLPTGVIASVDFNPAADRLRVIGSDGTSLRVNVDDGKVVKDGSLKYAATDANKDKTPKVVAGAYTNSVKGTKETTLFDIDAASGSLVKQAPPNDGILNTVGPLGARFDTIAFDIWSDGTRNEAWALIDGQLWSIDLATGKATAAGKIDGLATGAKDIAILPKM
ncbi:MAG: DUF4394 domain-containing protein [Reyranella sp.]